MMEEKIINILSKEKLQDNLSFIALFIGLYENFIDLIEERVKSFLCDGFFLDEKKNIKYRKSKLYKDLIEKRKVDDQGNMNSLKATMLWFVNVSAIDSRDYDLFIEIKKKRDKYVHQMAEFIWDGLDNSDTDLLVNLIEIYSKIDKWWINEIEIPTTDEEIPENYDPDSAISGSLLTFKIMLDVLGGDKSEEYLKIFQEKIQYKNL